MTVNRPDLIELLDVIRGAGKFATLGPGLHTYPHGDDNKTRLHGLCLELEALGQIRRKVDDPSHVLWLPQEGMLGAVSEAARFATRAHGAQVRKYTGEPYVRHCLAVAETVSRHTDREAVIAAAVLHDVLEDTATTRDQIREEFGEEVLQLVLEVTDVSASADGNRAARKALDREHLGRASPDGKTIKLADLLDNLASITEHDPKFSRVYLDEMALLLPLLQGGHPALYDSAVAALRGAEEALLQAALGKGRTMKYCCEKFAEEAGRLQAPVGGGGLYPASMTPAAQFVPDPDGTWSINGCCGGGCYVVTEMRFCPYCGSRI